MATETAPISIQRIGTETIRIPIVGTAPLIVHRFSEKAKRQMLDAMQGRKNPKQPKDPQAEYDSCFYRCDDGTYGFPALAFKAATVGAARFFGKDVTMTSLRQVLFMDAELSKTDGQRLVRINGIAELVDTQAEPVMREDVVRVGIGGTDLRYRPQFTEWSCVVDVIFVSSMLTRESVLSLVEAGGLGVGVGEWRPERKGDFGTYKIDPSRSVEVLTAANT